MSEKTLPQVTPSSSPLWVQKFGGTSVATPELMRNAVKRIKKRLALGYEVLVVVSAMGDTTDRLLNLASQLSTNPQKRELDMLLSAGEIQSMALLAMALHEAKIDSISISATQSGIFTDGQFSQARIERIDCSRIKTELEQKRVVVVAGFQGMTSDNEITTLGRGGSDTSAVALAAALKAEHCEILTDVCGVFTADPRIVPNAKKLTHIGYDEMIEMACHGAGVLHSRAVDIARRYQVPLSVASSTEDEPGTQIEVTKNKDWQNSMEQVHVRGIAQESAVCKVSAINVPDRPGIAAKLFSSLGEYGLSTRLIVQAQSHQESNDITFVLPTEPALDEAVLRKCLSVVEAESVLIDYEVGLLSVIGEGIARKPEIVSSLFKILAEKGVNIDVISTSDLVITCLVPEKQLEDGVRALHCELVEDG